MLTVDWRVIGFILIYLAFKNVPKISDFLSFRLFLGCSGSPDAVKDPEPCKCRTIHTSSSWRRPWCSSSKHKLIAFTEILYLYTSGPTFDASATRAATAIQIKSASSPDICFDVSDFRAGDFRFNLVPIALKQCDASVAGQKFDLITKVFTSCFCLTHGQLTLIPIFTGQTQQCSRWQQDNHCLQPAIYLH
jgi:hypothetical protein